VVLPTRRKTSFIIFFIVLAAGVNILLNFILIPLYGPLGAALSTLLAFMLLAGVAYIINQRPLTTVFRPF